MTRTARIVGVALTLALAVRITGSAVAAPAVGFVSERFIYLDEYDVMPDLREAGFEPVWRKESGPCCMDSLAQGRWAVVWRAI